jgi:hypothetical protein
MCPSFYFIFGVAAPLRKSVFAVTLTPMKTNDLTDRLQEFQQRATETARNVRDVTDEYVHENAWTSVAIAALAGCVIGFFLGRGRD